MDLFPALIVAGNLLLAGCGQAYPDPVSPGDPPECGYDELGRITAGYTAALVTACAPFESIDDCPEAVTDPVEKLYEPKFVEWENCR